MSDETTTDRLAEIEGQAEPQPVQVREGRWRTRSGDIRNIIPTPAKDERAVKYPWHDVNHDQTWLSSGRYHTGHTESPLDLWEYLGPFQPEPEAEPEPQPEPEPEQTITPDDVAAEALAGVWDQAKAEQEIAELQAQVRFLKGREVTLGTRLEEEKAVTTKRLQQVEELRSEVSHVQRLWGESRRRVEELEQKLAEALPEPQPVHLQAMVDSQAETIARLNSEIHELNMEIGGLQHRLQAVSAEFGVQLETNNRLQVQLEAVKAESAKRLEQVEELRSKVSYVLGEGITSRKAVNAAVQDKADVQHRLDTVAAEWATQAETIRGLETQLEAVKAELVQVSKDRQALQIELDAREQVPQAVSDRFEEGWDAGTTRAVETIAEWTEPFRTCGSQGLALAVLQNLPHIMRTLTGLTDED